MVYRFPNLAVGHQILHALAFQTQIEFYTDFIDNKDFVDVWMLLIQISQLDEIIIIF